MESARAWSPNYRPLNDHQIYQNSLDCWTRVFALASGSQVTCLQKSINAYLLIYVQLSRFRTPCTNCSVTTLALHRQLWALQREQRWQQRDLKASGLSLRLSKLQNSQQKHPISGGLMITGTHRYGTPELSICMTSFPNVQCLCAIQSFVQKPAIGI